MSTRPDRTLTHIICQYHIQRGMFNFDYISPCTCWLRLYMALYDTKHGGAGIMNTKKNYSYILMMVKPFLCETICRQHKPQYAQYNIVHWKIKSSHSLYMYEGISICTRRHDDTFKHSRSIFGVEYNIKKQ